MEHVLQRCGIDDGGDGALGSRLVEQRPGIRAGDFVTADGRSEGESPFANERAWYSNDAGVSRLEQVETARIVARPQAEAEDLRVRKRPASGVIEPNGQTALTRLKILNDWERGL